jgi:hypothetical protein
MCLVSFGWTPMHARARKLAAKHVAYRVARVDDAAIPLLRGGNAAAEGIERAGADANTGQSDETTEAERLQAFHS